MKIEKRLDGDSLTFILNGGFDKEIAETERYLIKNIKADCRITKRIVFDLSKVYSLNMQGLTLLLGVKGKLTGGAKICIANANDTVYGFLEKEGITELIDVKKS